MNPLYEHLRGRHHIKAVIVGLEVTWQACRRCEVNRLADVDLRTTAA